MSKHQTNTNLLIKQKFESYAPLPPGHVWNGIQAGIAVKPVFFLLYWKSIVVVAIILSLATAGVWYFLENEPKIEYQNELSDTNVIHNEPGEEGLNIESDKNIHKRSNEEFELDQGTKEEGTHTGFNPDQKTIPAGQSLQTASDNPKNGQLKNSSAISAETFDNGVAHTNAKEKLYLKENTDFLAISYLSNDNEGKDPWNTNNDYIGKINSLSKTDIDNYYLSQYASEQTKSIQAISINNLLDTEITDFTKKRTKWSIGFYFAPEMMLSNFDSIEMLTNYSFGVEPTYYINNHLFIRFGIGATYSRDRGFAKLDYLSNDLLGTYEYVHDITFDSVDGEVVPTYHTTTAEVWDTVRHLDINSISNNYVYLQVPALFGYYSSKSKINWYFYGGPAFNLMVSKQIDKPLEGLDYIDLNNLQTELPERSPYYFQLWLGAGIEYKAGKNLGVAIEPSYRYYFKNVFNTPPYSSSGISGLSLRVGLVYTIQ